MSMHRIRGIATLVGVSALVLAGPTAAAVADSDLQTFEGSQDPQAEDDREWSLERSDDSDAEDTQSEQDSDLGSLFAQEGDSPRDAQDTTSQDTTSDDTAASGPAEDFCEAAFADDEDARAQCMEMAESFPDPEEGSDEGGDEEQEPLQQFCDEAFSDNEDAHTQCTDFAGTLTDEGGEGEDDPTENDPTDDGEDDSTGEDGEEDNPFQQFCDEAFADNEDAHAQCTEFAGNFEQDEGGDEEDPLQQFCDEAFADNEDAHAQCTDVVQALAGEEEGDGDGDDDDTTDDDSTDEEEDTTDDQDESATLDQDQTASPAADSGALPVTGMNVAVATLSSLSLLGMGGALLRRFRADSLG